MPASCISMPTRWFTTLLVAAMICPALAGQEEEEPSLGQVAREARQAKAEQVQPESRKVIDDDNFSRVLTEAEAARIAGKPVFSIDSVTKTFRMTSPDGSCSLSFDARATSLISSAFVTTDLPQDDFAKLEGTASVHDDVVEVSLRNDSAWEIREVVIGITVLQKTPAPAANISDPLLPTESRMVSDPTWVGKQPDQTVIYHLRGSAAAKASATFTAPLGADSNVAFSPSQEWHWALISARGIPPASPASLQSAQILGPAAAPSAELTHATNSSSQSPPVSH